MIQIVIEGLDGTGKSTLAKALSEALQAETPAWVYQTKEPGSETRVGGAVFNRPGLNIRDIVLTDKSLTSFERELLFYVDASQHKRFIENQDKAFFVSDRGIWSHYAYLYATLKTKQIDYEQYQALRKVIEFTCRKPEVLVYLQGDTALMKERNKDKVKDVIESNKDDFFEAVSLKYGELSCEPKYTERLLILEATNSTSQNVETVLDYLKKEFTDEELRSGNLNLCQR